MTAFTNYYTVLGVQPECSAAELKKAYHSLAKRFHPDLHPGNPEATIKMQLINEAYLILSDSEARALYDIECRHHKTYKNEQQKQQQNGTSEYQYQSEILNDWIAKARQQAKDITAQAIRDAGGLIRDAGYGFVQGIVKAIVWMVVVSFIFVLRQGCK